MKTDQYKYLILFPIPDPYRSTLHSLMDEVAKHTKIPPPYAKIEPHITFHRPVHDIGISEEIFKDLVRSAVLQMRGGMKITVSDFFAFGKQYIVMPVHATRSLASLWIVLNDLISGLPGYKSGKFDDDNTLHVSIAEKTSAIFDDVWPRIKQIQAPTLTILVENVELYRKPIEDGKWERLETYPIPR